MPNFVITIVPPSNLALLIQLCILYVYAHIKYYYISYMHISYCANQILSQRTLDDTNTSPIVWSEERVVIFGKRKQLASSWTQIVKGAYCTCVCRATEIEIFRQHIRDIIVAICELKMFKYFDQTTLIIKRHIYNIGRYLSNWCNHAK